MFYSSFVFLINVSIAVYYGYYLYAGLFFVLVITSLFHHSYYSSLTNILDKIAIFSIVFYGGYLFYKKLTDYIYSDKLMTTKEYILSFFIVLTFLSNIVFYYYGYYYNCLCFCDDQICANTYHSLMHCIGSFRHCCIVFL
jgi:hypothetical protein